MRHQAKAQPWRSYLRIGLRTLIFLVLLSGGGLGWLIQSTEPSERP